MMGGDEQFKPDTPTTDTIMAEDEIDLTIAGPTVAESKKFLFARDMDIVMSDDKNTKRINISELIRDLYMKIEK